jgi:hypothetical protein
MVTNTEPIVKRPRVETAAEFGDATNFWVEYPSGLVDLSSTTHLSQSGVEPSLKEGLWDIACDGERKIRVDPKSSALIVIDMQKFDHSYTTLSDLITPLFSYFLHPDIRDHPKGLKCVDPLIATLPAFRSKGAHVLWVYVLL